MRTSTNFPGMIYVKRIPSPIKNSEYPITLFIFSHQKSIYYYNICFLFLIYLLNSYLLSQYASRNILYSSSVTSTASDKISFIFPEACSLAAFSSFEPSDLSLLLVNLFTKSGTISRSFVMPS